MKRSRQGILEFQDRQEAEWKRRVQAGPRRWRTFRKVGYPLLGMLMVLVGVTGLLTAIHSIRSGNLAKPIGQDARGLLISPSDSLARNVAMIFGALGLIWLGIRKGRRKKGDTDGGPTS
jgi:hypothetical protein